MNGDGSVKAANGLGNPTTNWNIVGTELLAPADEVIK
jgi:hypothetical protein